MVTHTRNYILTRRIPDFFAQWRVMVGNSNDLDVYRDVNEAYPTQLSKPLRISAAGAAQNAFTAKNAGDMVHALALSLWHHRRAESGDIFKALESVDPELERVVEAQYRSAKRKQVGYYEATKERR